MGEVVASFDGIFPVVLQAGKAIYLLASAYKNDWATYTFVDPGQGDLTGNC
jgi:hypothetical protein